MEHTFMNTHWNGWKLYQNDEFLQFLACLEKNTDKWNRCVELNSYMIRPTILIHFHFVYDVQ